MDHPAIFQPLQLRHLTLRNRIVFGAHTANMSEGGLPGERHLGYYRERALGGVAMIVVEPVPIHHTAVLTRGNFRADDDAVIPHFRRITDAVHAEGAHIRALGRPHSGPDTVDNVLCLCPNHHTLFDEGGIYVGDDLRVHDHRGAVIGKLTKRAQHPIDVGHLQSHRERWGY